MKRLLISFTTLVLFVTPQFTLAADVVDLEEFANKFINAQNKAWQQGILNELEELEDPNAVYHMAGGIDNVGWEGHKQYILAGRQAAIELEQEWKYLTGDGNLIALSYKSSSILADQKNTSDLLFLLRLDKGKIVEAWSNGSSSVTEIEQ